MKVSKCRFISLGCSTFLRVRIEIVSDWLETGILSPWILVSWLRIALLRKNSGQHFANSKKNYRFYSNICCMN